MSRISTVQRMSESDGSRTELAVPPVRGRMDASGPPAVEDSSQDIGKKTDTSP